MKLVWQYTDIQELNAEIIRTFVDKIYVEKSEKVPAIRTEKQTLWIQWNVWVQPIFHAISKIGVADITTDYADTFLEIKFLRDSPSSEEDANHSL